MLRKADRSKGSMNSFMYRLSSLSQSGDVAADPLRALEFSGFE
jgi:hypothetical protein